MKINTADNLYMSYMNMISFDKDTETFARTRFNELKSSLVIKPISNFDDIVWDTTDEYANIGIHFKFNQLSYQRNWKTVFQLEFQDFVTCVKCFMISLFGRLALKSMENIILDLRRIITSHPDKIHADNDNLIIRHPLILIDFFTTLPGSDYSQDLLTLITDMDNFSDRNIRSASDDQRELSDIDTYALFNRIIRDYWNSRIPQKERLFYYPLYLWWSLTAIIPLRPREFLLTQRNCLHIDRDGEFWITLRRNNLKGNRRNITYKLSDDYRTDTYHIPKQLGDEFQKYINLTSCYKSTDLDSLFVTDPHYKKWGQKKHDNSRFLTYINMTTILRYFYNEIIIGKYGFTVVPEPVDRFLEEHEIGVVHLGDTRHIALANLMEEGGTPALAMVLAGHSDINTSAHYYSNIKKIIECKTYRQYRKQITGKVQYRLSQPVTVLKTKRITRLSDGGGCSSEKFATRDFSDCKLSSGPNGEIGFCPNCHCYCPPDSSGLISESIYLKNLKDDCDTLCDAVECYRKEKGSVEEIGQALLRLKASSISYQQYLIEKQNQ